MELRVQDVAALKGCSEQYIRKCIACGKLPARVADDPANKVKEWKISLDDLDPALQAKYRNERAAEILPAVPRQQATRALEQYTAEERESIRLWSQLLLEWQGYRNNPAHKSKVEVDQRFVAMKKLTNPELAISEGTLYRKWAAYKNGDLDALIDRRGQWAKGKSKAHPRLLEMAEDFFLDDRQFPISKCVEYVELWAREFSPELMADFPSYHAFRRHLQSLPSALVTMGREGEKAYADRRGPYVDRYYDDLRTNEYWIADTHTMDVRTKADDGKLHRLYLVAFIDARSQLITGWTVTESPGSDAVLLALRHGILRCGIPEHVYLDNGREFLNRDIGGLGHRQKKSTRDEPTPPPIFARLGIEMVNAIVRNAKAKPIERTFKDLKYTISQVFSTYTGGNVLEKPAGLKQRLKQGAVSADQELRDAVDAILDGVYNMGEYGGKVKADQGKSRVNVFNASLVNKRVATAEDLTLLLMRTTKPQTIGRNGVYVTLYGEKVFFWSEETHFQQGKRVYVRFDPADLAEVRIYDAETDKYLMSAPMHRDCILRFGGEDKAAVAEAMRTERAAQRATKTLLDSKRRMTSDERIDALGLLVNQANRNRTGMEIGNGRALEPVRAGERMEPKQAVNGGEVIVIDQKKLNRVAELRQAKEE